eukprot:3565545-Prorocentrum_lima.AAC.1
MAIVTSAARSAPVWPPPWFLVMQSQVGPGHLISVHSPGPASVTVAPACRMAHRPSHGRRAPV